MKGFYDMKRNEKFGMIIGLVAGLLMLLFSVLVSLHPLCTVQGAQKSGEQGDHANSWRYQDGKPREDSEKTARSIARVQKPANASAQGIDVSKYQGEIDWQKVQNSGLVDFAILRCGYGTNQTNWDDERWNYNSSECERLGIPYGVYLYSYADNTTKAKSEAQHVIRLIKGKKLSYPIYYDIEDKVMEKLSVTQLGEIVKTFTTTLESAGYTNIGIYSNRSWFTEQLTAPVFSKYPKWVASWGNTCSYSGNYHMWQYTSKGTVPGISGTVDMNFKIGNWSRGGYSPSVKINRSTLSLTAGKSSTLKAADPVKSSYRISVAWSSSNKKIATVNSSGKVTAKSAGKVTITARISNGQRSTCTVTVKPKTNKISKLKKSGKNSIKISWTKVSGTTKYQVYMSTKKKSGYQKIKTASAKSSSYTKTKLKKKKTYYFKVRSYKRVGGKNYYSAFSAVKSIKR